MEEELNNYYPYEFIKLKGFLNNIIKNFDSSNEMAIMLLADDLKSIIHSASSLKNFEVYIQKMEFVFKDFLEFLVDNQGAVFMKLLGLIKSVLGEHPLVLSQICN